MFRNWLNKKIAGFVAANTEKELIVSEVLRQLDLDWEGKRRIDDGVEKWIAKLDTKSVIEAAKKSVMEKIDIDTLARTVAEDFDVEAKIDNAVDEKVQELVDNLDYSDIYEKISDTLDHGDIAKGIAEEFSADYEELAAQIVRLASKALR